MPGLQGGAGHPSRAGRHTVLEVCVNTSTRGLVSAQLAFVCVDPGTEALSSEGLSMGH